MYEKFSEQLQSSLKPANELFAINAKAMEQLAKQQTGLFTSLLNVNVALAKDLSSKQDLASAIETQKAYAQDVQSKLVAAAKDAAGVITKSQEEASKVIKGAMTQAKDFSAFGTTAK